MSDFPSDKHLVVMVTEIRKICPKNLDHAIAQKYLMFQKLGYMSIEAHMGNMNVISECSSDKIVVVMVAQKRQNSPNNLDFPQKVVTLG